MTGSQPPRTATRYNAKMTRILKDAKKILALFDAGYSALWNGHSEIAALVPPPGDSDPAPPTFDVKIVLLQQLDQRKVEFTEHIVFGNEKMGTWKRRGRPGESLLAPRLFKTLNALEASPLGAQRLAKSLGISVPNAWNAIQFLRERGLIESLDAPKGHKTHRLTAAGRALLGRPAQ